MLFSLFTKMHVKFHLIVKLKKKKKEKKQQKPERLKQEKNESEIYWKSYLSSSSIESKDVFDYFYRPFSEFIHCRPYPA